ncbi:MAG: type II toxin-antitoxin system VapC family toxin [Verrucomicrobia bacterium]|nr:type II toxin-antitoxin system VapC family toxin [Verrucomicrobiota bacterium]
MKRLRLYLDTSVINFLHADDAPEKREATVKFFEQVVQGSESVFVSQLVLREIERTPDPARRAMLLKAIRENRLGFLPVEPVTEVRELAKAYLQAGIIPARAEDDAVHVAIATVNEVDVLVSWNFKHLANVHRERRIAVVNESLGYVYPLRITSPLEVMNYG